MLHDKFFSKFCFIYYVILPCKGHKYSQDVCLHVAYVAHHVKLTEETATASFETIIFYEKNYTHRVIQVSFLSYMHKKLGNGY